MPCYARRIAALRLELHANAAALPAPTAAGDGAAVPATWRTDPSGLQRAFELCTIEIIGNPVGARTLTAPVLLWGYDGTTWWQLATLNKSETITIGAGGGWAGDVLAYAAVWQRLAVSCTISGNVDVYVTPIDPLTVADVM